MYAEDYLYPVAYFEPVEFTNGHATFNAATVHVPEWMYGVLYAEAVAADQSVSALLRHLLAEHYDLPEQDEVVQRLNEVYATADSRPDQVLTKLQAQAYFNEAW